jgi:hypothetical protein
VKQNYWNGVVVHRGIKVILQCIWEIEKLCIWNGIVLYRKGIVMHRGIVAYKGNGVWSCFEWCSGALVRMGSGVHV